MGLGRRFLKEYCVPRHLALPNSLQGGSAESRGGGEGSLPESRVEGMIPKAPSMISTWIRFAFVSPFYVFLFFHITLPRLDHRNLKNYFSPRAALWSHRKVHICV